MRDARLAELARRQFNRVSRLQLVELGFSRKAIEHRITTGRLVSVEEGVLAIAPVLEHAAWGFWSLPRTFETVTRPGSGGPRRHGGMLVYRSSVLEAEATSIRGIPITSVERTLLDLARVV